MRATIFSLASNASHRFKDRVDNCVDVHQHIPVSPSHSSSHLEGNDCVNFSSERSYLGKGRLTKVVPTTYKVLYRPFGPACNSFLLAIVVPSLFLVFFILKVCACVATFAKLSYLGVLFSKERKRGKKEIIFYVFPP